jgi:hypothetical protein
MQILQDAHHIFETWDYEGITVCLSKNTWYSKAGDGSPGTHPEIRDYLEDIKATVESPDLVFKSTREERSRVFYKLHVCRGVFAGRHLATVVKYVEEPEGLRGYISTMYITRSVYSKGLKLWEKKQI